MASIQVSQAIVTRAEFLRAVIQQRVVIWRVFLNLGDELVDDFGAQRILEDCRRADGRREKVRDGGGRDRESGRRLL